MNELEVGAMPTNEPLLRVDGLQIEVPASGGRWLRAVDDVSFTVGAGETVGLVGESGSGKTLVSMALIGMAQAVGARIAGGSVDFAGQRLTELPAKQWRRLPGREIGMIFQQPIRSLNPAYTVGEQIAESARKHLGMNRRQAMARAVEMLDLVQIPQAAQRVKEYPHAFSGGMCQRVMIAMAMVANPRLLIADEPTTALDVTVQARILELIRGLQEETGISVLLISHDLGVIAETCHRSVVMYAGQVVEEGGTDEVFLQPRHPYTSALLGSISAPVVRPDGGRRLRSIPGTIPQVGTAPEGCRFAPRCEHADAVCTAPARISLQTATPHPVRCLRTEVLTLEGVAAR